MKIKITDRTETMFAQAVSLSQSGRMKSTIYGLGKDLFILNMDDTILIKYEINQTFEQPVSFLADDYESNELMIENNQVTFITKQDGYERKKLCRLPEITFDVVKSIWDKFEIDLSAKINFNEKILSLLDDDLSHVEIHNEGGLKLIQKNIYSGLRIEIKNITDSVGLLNTNLLPSFPPIGMRVKDFKALFSFSSSILFFLQKDKNYVYFQDSHNILKGIISTCLYDELGYISNSGV